MRAARVRLCLAASLCILAVSASSGSAGVGATPKNAGGGLRNGASARGLALGSALNYRALASDATYAAVAAREFNMLTTENEMRWAYTEPTQGEYDFSAGDTMVRFAQQNRMKVRGHNLVWHELNPAWLETGMFNRDTLVKILHDHITAVVSHFRGQVADWDVVNEPLDAAGNLRDTIWSRGIGPEYIPMAFQWARDADPKAKLFVNEYGLETPGPKLDGMVRLVAQLKSQHVPIDGVGFQSHFGLGDPISTSTGKQLGSSLGRFRRAGVATAITELDVALSSPPSPADLANQASVYRTVLTSCFKASTCRTVVVWGFTDAHSWIPAFKPGLGAATLLDATYTRKSAYDAWDRLL